MLSLYLLKNKMMSPNVLELGLWLDIRVDVKFKSVLEGCADQHHLVFEEATDTFLLFEGQPLQIEHINS